MHMKQQFKDIIEFMALITKMQKNIIFVAGSALIHRNIFRGLSRPVMLCQV